VIAGLIVVEIAQFSGFSVFLRNSWNTATFITNYLPFVLFPILYLVGRYLIYRTPMVAAQDMDFVSGIAEVEADSYEEPPPKNRVEKFWQWLM
jgi:amino acid transporter